MAVSDMVVENPLVAARKGPQLFQATATADWKSNKVTIRLYSVTTDGKKISDHAHCLINYASRNEWLKEWKRNEYLIRSRISSLHKNVNDGQIDTMKSGMVYKLFGALMEYSQSYKGMQQVVLDSTQLEATARVEFQTTDEDGEFYLPPYWIDSLGQVGGFTMNANDGTDSRSTVFVNHGWESMRCATRFSREKTYQTYVKMQNVGGTMFAGDVYIFESDSMVAIYQGVKVSLISRFDCMKVLTSNSFKAFLVGPSTTYCRPRPLVSLHRNQ